MPHDIGTFLREKADDEDEADEDDPTVFCFRFTGLCGQLLGVRTESSSVVSGVQLPLDVIPISYHMVKVSE